VFGVTHDACFGGSTQAIAIKWVNNEIKETELYKERDVMAKALGISMKTKKGDKGGGNLHGNDKSGGKTVGSSSTAGGGTAANTKGHDKDSNRSGGKKRRAGASGGAVAKKPAADAGVVDDSTDRCSMPSDEEKGNMNEEGEDEEAIQTESELGMGSPPSMDMYDEAQLMMR
jgi:hypothetical protein